MGGMEPALPRHPELMELLALYSLCETEAQSEGTLGSMHYIVGTADR